MSKFLHKLAEGLRSCVFRNDPATDSKNMRPVIPILSGQ